MRNLIIRQRKMSNMRCLKSIMSDRSWVYHLWAKARSNQSIKLKVAKSLRNLINYLHKAKCWKSGGCRVSCQAKGGSVCPAQAPSNQPIKFFALLWFITRLMLMIMGPFVTSWLDINSSHISGDFEQKDAQQCSCVVVWQLKNTCYPKGPCALCNATYQMTSPTCYGRFSPAMNSILPA